MKFETVMLVNPTIANADEEFENTKEFIKKQGTITDEEKWGLRKLAYKIQKHDEAYYYLVKFEADEDYPTTLNNYYNTNENILKHIIVKVD